MDDGPPAELWAALRRARRIIEDSGHAARPAREGEELLAAMLEVDRSYLSAHPEQRLSQAQSERFDGLVTRRAAGEPIAYLTGAAEFFGRGFVVDRSVLIPRPETEGIVTRALELSPPPQRILDVGTGSGALAITLALETQARVVAVDLSRAALGVAIANGRRLAATVRFVRGDGLAAFRDETFDLVVANPPYVDPADRATLPVEVRDHEPALALFSPGGLAHIEPWLGAAGRVLRPGGRVLCEIGYGQGDAVRALSVVESSLELLALHRDENGIERIVEARRRLSPSEGQGAPE